MSNMHILAQYGLKVSATETKTTPFRHKHLQYYIPSYDGRSPYKVI